MLSESDIEISVTKKAKESLVKDGYSLDMGARPLKRLIQKSVENKISEAIIDDIAKKGSRIVVDHNDLGFFVTVDESSKSDVLLGSMK